jgi:hypothetical protein
VYKLFCLAGFCGYCRGKKCGKKDGYPFHRVINLT